MSLEECAGRRRDQAKILRRITLPLAVPGLISAGIFSFTLSGTVHLRARLHPEQRQQG